MKALQLRLERLEQRQEASRPALSPVVLYRLGEALPDLAEPPDGRALFLIPDNGRSDLATTAQPCAVRPAVNA